LEPTPSPSPIVESPNIDESSANLLSVLIVGVDELTRQDPTLRAVWVMLYDATRERLYLHGIPIDINTIEGGVITLEDSFRWSLREGLDPDFMDALHQILPLSPDLIVVNDETAFASAVNYLGGVEIEGAELDGESVLAFLSLSWEKPGVLLSNQALLLEALVPRALTSAPSPELTELIELIPEHVYLSLDVTDAVSLLTPLREISPDNIFFILLD
jgi:hypothetical protein